MSGLPDAPEYAARLRSVYQAAFHDDWAQDAYFVVRTPVPATDDELIRFGLELLRGLRLLAKLAIRSGGEELHEYLCGVNQVVVVQPGGCDPSHDDHLMVHESVGDILSRYYDYGHDAVQLREGFYSVACDYWLAWYLQWPYFRRWMPQDVFRPYFELWARGCEIAFQCNSLYIARRAEPATSTDPDG